MSEYRLIYVSCSNLSGEPQAVANAVQSLVVNSRAANADRQVTGMLLFSGHHFAQILEGSADVLVSLYSRIREDSRHHSVYTLSFERIKNREFADWSMAIRGLSAKDLTQLEGGGPHNSVLTPTAAGGNIVQFLEFLLSNKEKELKTISALAQGAQDNAYQKQLQALTSHTI